MSDIRIARLFKNGASQAVRLPAEFRFEGEEVFVRRDDTTGDVILSQNPVPGSWEKLFQLLDSLDDTADYMAERPLNLPPRERQLFQESD